MSIKYKNNGMFKTKKTLKAPTKKHEVIQTFQFLKT